MSLPSAGEQAAIGAKAEGKYLPVHFAMLAERNLDEAARIDFIRLMWEVCYADGELHELEDNTLWRVAELIGVDSRERIAARQNVKRLAGSKIVN